MSGGGLRGERYACGAHSTEIRADVESGLLKRCAMFLESLENIYPLLDNKRDGLKCGGNEGVAGDLKAWDIKMAVGSPRIGCARACWGRFYEV